MKKILVLLVIFIISIAFSSCSNQQTTSTSETTSSKTTSSETTSSETTTIKPITTESSLELTTVENTCAVYEVPDIDVVHTVITETSFSFELDYVETGCNGYIDKMYVYDKYSLSAVYSFDDFNQISFEVDNLESRNDYTLRIEYKSVIEGYLRNMVILYNFRTLSGITVEALNITKTNESFSFDLNIIDPDSVVYISSIEVISNGRHIGNINQLGPYSLTGLTSYTKYKVEINYTYPIRNDSYAYKYETLILWITTLPDFPLITIEEDKATETTFDFMVNVFDPENLITIESFGLYQGETLIFSLQNPEDAVEQDSFTDLEPSTEYTIKITYNYDNGAGIETVNYEYSFYTLEPNPMEFDIMEISDSPDTLSFVVEFNSIGDVFIVFEVNLYLNGNLIESKLYPGLDFIFNDLEADTTYVLEVIAGYNCTGDICEDTYTKEASFTTEVLPIE